MRKELGLIVMGAVAFDLGTVVVSAQTVGMQDFHFVVEKSLAPQSDYLKFQGDYLKLKLADACIANKGTLVEFNGDKYCRTAKAGSSGTTLPSNADPKATGPATTVPSNQRK